MEDEKLEHKRAFHYALEGDEFLAKISLSKVPMEDLQDIANACCLLDRWAQEVFWDYDG